MAIVSSAILAAELIRWSNADRRLFALLGVLCDAPPDWAPFLPFALLLPVLWWHRPRQNAVALNGRAVDVADRDIVAPERNTHRRSLLAAGLLTCVVFVVAAFTSLAVASAFTDARGRPYPPAYHDEYSYLFQAQTFLAGRTWFPSFEPRPELFDQMHVLNLGRFASRYFPGVGVWLAPSVALADPWFDQRLAHAICAVLMFWIGRELRGNLCGAVSGLLFALSPGLAIFSTLLLAHHPTLLGLLTFLWMFLRLMRRPDTGTSLIAGCGLAYAMLCRPMTAAGFALPFGMWTVWYLASGGRKTAEAADDAGKAVTEGKAHSGGLRPPLAVVVGLALPLLAGMAVMGWYSWSITGDPLMSPYQHYTDEYTPRHVYGFNNVIRGEQHLGPHVVQNYDEWAENLTPRLAADNTWRRLIACLRLTLGIVPISFAVLFLLVKLLPGRPRSPSNLLDGELLLLASIVSLFAVHVPYWFVGIMEWHYVLEAAPLWLLLAGVATSDLWQWCRRSGWYGPIAWWGGVLATALAVNTFHVPLATSGDETWWLWRARLPQLISEVRFARSRYGAVTEEVDRLRGDRQAVLLVIPDPADRSLDYVTNEPSLTGEVLRIRVPTGETAPAALRRIADLFPERLPLVFDAAAGQLGPLQGG